MAGGINISWNPGEKKARLKKEELDRRQDRQKEILSYLPKLQEQYTPEEVSSIARRYIEGEGLNLPTMRSRLLPPEEGVDVPSRSTLEPLKYIEPTTTVYDKTTGEYKMIPGKNAKIYGNETKEDEKEVDVTQFDEETGKLTNLGKVKKGSKVITTKKPTGKGPSTMKEFQDQAALKVLKDYFTLEATGQDLSNIQDSAISAAKRFGMSIEQVKEDPGFFKRLIGMEGETTEKPSFTEPGVRAPSTSKEDKPKSKAPYGETTVRNGKTYKWSDSDGKYHLVK